GHHGYHGGGNGGFVLGAALLGLSVGALARPAPVYAAPAPVYYAPRPRVVYAYPAPTYVYPAPVYAAPVGYAGYARY
ncbi:MAG: virulence factor, partial [Bdellovibrionales bacterium]